MSHDMFGAYNEKTCNAAILNLWLAPETLTEEQIAQLTLLSAEIGDDARQRRQGVTDPDADRTDHERKVARGPVTLNYFLAFGKHFLYPLLAISRYKIKMLAQRIEALEARPPGGGVQWAGVYAEGKTYDVGDLVQRSGLWLCTGSTASKPGTDHEHWRLLVKQYFDGHDRDSA